MTTYICENGHEKEKHKSQPAGHGQKAVCIECNSLIVERTVPQYECLVCGFSWFYTGSSDRPTCPECKGKKVEQVGEV